MHWGTMCENVKVQIISTIAGTGTAGFSGDNGPATSAQIDTPNDVSISSSTNELYIAEILGNRIRKINNNNYCRNRFRWIQWR